MNPKPISETEALRSDIDMTRRRMDDTVDALGNRLQPRHLIDEVIGYFRNNGTSDRAAEIRDKVANSASSAAQAVVGTVKHNPLPVLLIGAGVAWLAYSATRDRSADRESAELEDEGERFDPSTHYDRQLEYPIGSGMSDSTSDMEEGIRSKFDSLKDTAQEKAASAKEKVKEKLSNVGDAARGKMDEVRERASEIGSRVRERAGEMQDRAREAYDKTRERVVRTADEHPIELGLGCLAVGLLVGLALPTPQPVNRIAGPTVDRLRRRTREAGSEMVEKGKRVVQAATHAAKDEANTQGLSLERLRENVGASSEPSQNESASANPREGTVPADPSAARPEM